MHTYVICCRVLERKGKRSGRIFHRKGTKKKKKKKRKQHRHCGGTRAIPSLLSLHVRMVVTQMRTPNSSLVFHVSRGEEGASLISQTSGSLLPFSRGANMLSVWSVGKVDHDKVM